MKKINKLISIIICIALVCALFSGCHSKEKNIDFIYPIDGNISSFDPQVASTEDEFLIAENCYEGLVRVLDDGTVMPACATSWVISDDSLTYTFYLKQGLKWNISNEKNSEGLYKDSRIDLVGYDFNPDITADDFVFALRRSCAPETNAPLFSSVSGIINANDVHSGSLDRSYLGVKAIDDYTLEITLTSPDDSFLSTLATAVAMPCNEEFFNATKGRYGLSVEYSLFNGQFYVKNILDNSYVLDKNEKYFGDNQTEISDITLSVKNDDTDVAKNLKSGLYDCAYISGAEYEKIIDDGITVIPYSNQLWAFLFNKNKDILQNEKMREAICISINGSDFEHSYLQRAVTLAPPSCLIGSQSAVEAMGKTVPEPDSEKATQLWKEGLEETGFSQVNITIICTEEMYEVSKLLVQGIQASIGNVTSYGDNDESKISFSLKIEPLTKADFETAVAKSEYDIALYPFTATTHNTVSFYSELLGGNYIGEVESAEQALYAAQVTDFSNLKNKCVETEEAIISDYSLFPVLYESSYYAQAKGVSSVQFHPGSGRVCFVYATREK